MRMRRNLLVPGLLALAAAALLAVPAAQAGVVAPTSYDFGDVPVGTTATVKVSVIPSMVCEEVSPVPDNGPAVVCTSETIAAGGTAFGDGFRSGATSCGTAMFGSKCDVTLTFTPPSAGRFTGSAVVGTVIAPASSAKQLSVKLSGTGTPAGPGSGGKPGACKPKPRKKPVKAKSAAKKKPKRKPCRRGAGKQKPKK